MKQFGYVLAVTFCLSMAEGAFAQANAPANKDRGVETRAGEARESGRETRRDARKTGREMKKEGGTEGREAGREMKQEGRETTRDTRQEGRDARRDAVRK